MSELDRDQSQLNPYAAPASEELPRNAVKSSLMYEATLFGGLAAMIGGVALLTAASAHPILVNVGALLFGLGFLALIATLR
ncbi:hypothetical protein Mal15_16840 [Stieleria maiorica]|uniref:Uncharacterized protein n=1 Tax=Stieleria maiorica TaxID=2795974 RepID=A0A5B9MAE0_9BACT|nr:hypothetical protein [Stieleria maiorica]QEF97643.1 hypothetical protein Mal15_16840 [Stieleria maiorica]